jgi:signal transduction histidine kinase
MKDRFLSSVSHEMKTPLTAIVSGSELLSTIVPEEDPAREFVTLIDHQARQLTSTVDRIMRFQVLGRTRIESASSAIDPLAVVRSVVQELSDKAAAREVGIALDLPARVVAIRGDAEALGLALKEIVDNAVKFAPMSGVVTVSVRENLVRWTRPVSSGDPGQPAPARSEEREEHGEAQEEEEEMFVVFSVKDGGPGIPLEHQTRIFEKFEQLGDLLTSKPDGLGLGLPLAREIARRHGGDLFVQSEMGEGSEFRLYVPVRPHPGAPAGGRLEGEATR